jgi:HSP20 family protein
MRTLVKSNNNYYSEVPSIFDDFSVLRNLFQQGVSKPVNTSPAVNVKETETAYELEIAAPGLLKEDFTINVEGQTLTITSEKETKEEEKEKTYKITAAYTNGVLQLTIPKIEKANNKLSKTISVA